MNFENMTKKEIRSTRNKLAFERENRNKKKLTTDMECKRYIRKRDRQVSQAKMQLYAFGYILAMFVGVFLGENLFHFNMTVFAVINLLIPVYILIVYLVIPGMTKKSCLTYRMRYFIPGILYFVAQTILIIPVGEFGGTDTTIPFIPIAFYILIGIPIVMIQNRLEKRVYEEREKDIFQKFSWNDWYSKEIFEYEHMSQEDLNAEIERVAKIDEQIRACNAELKARKMEARLNGDEE